MNRFINLLLLVVMSFSIAHGVVLDDAYEGSHCSPQDYIAEFSKPVYHEEIHEHENENDTCDSHYIFHIPFLLPDTFSLLEIDKQILIFHRDYFQKPFNHRDNSFRPPIV